LQILTNYIEQNKDIHGIKVDNEVIKQSLFADNGNQHSFEQPFDCLQRFSKCSGLNLNINKSILLIVGTLKTSNVKYCTNLKFAWTSECASALGITFYNNNGLDTVKKYK